MHLFYVFFLLPTFLCCASGEYYIPGSNGVCTSCDSSCTECYWDYAVKCTSCNNQYFFDSALDACTACPLDCLKCSVSATLCEQCKAGYTLETDDSGVQSCILHWWVIFLWTFGLLFGAVIVVGLFLWLKNKCGKEEQDEEKKDYQMTREDIKN